MGTAGTSRATARFKHKLLPTVIAARRRNKPMKLKAARTAAAAVKRRTEAPETVVAREARADVTIDDFLNGAFTQLVEDTSDEDGADEEDSDASDVELTADEGPEVRRSGGEEAASSEGEGEDGALAGVRASNRALRTEVSRHVSDLEALKQKDPEFYAFLAATDAQLLSFRDSDDEADDAAPVLAAAPTAATRGEQEDKGGLLTTARVEAWCAAAAAGTSLGATAKVLRGFRACAHYGDAVGDEDQSGAEGSVQLRIASSSAFNRLVVFVMDNMDRTLRCLLAAGDAAPHPRAAAAGSAPLLFHPEKQARWKKVEPLARSFLGNSVHLLTQLQDPGVTAYVLRSLSPAAPFAVPFPRLSKKLLRAALARFGDGSPAVRLAAVQLLRALAFVSPPEGLDACFRGAYRTFAANAKFSGTGQLETVAFMAAGVTELLALDTTAAYPLAFSAIRQLALLLRAALSAKSKDAYRAVYCWQTTHCLELWARVLSAHAVDPAAPLRPLVYPLVQVVSGAARLLPTARHAPLRLRLLCLLQRLGGALNVYIPVASQALELLSFAELSRPPLVRAGGASGDYTALLRVPKAELRSPAFQAFVVDSALDLVAQSLAQWAYHPALPELAHLPVRELRRFAASTPAPKFHRAAAALADAVARNAEWISRRRDAAEFAPKDCAPGAPALAGFLSAERQRNEAPLAPVVGARQAAARQRAAAAHATDVRVADVGHRSANDDSDDGAATASLLKQGKRDKQRVRPADTVPVGRQTDGEDFVHAFLLSDEDEDYC